MLDFSDVFETPGEEGEEEEYDGEQSSTPALCPISNCYDNLAAVRLSGRPWPPLRGPACSAEACLPWHRVCSGARPHLGLFTSFVALRGDGSALHARGRDDATYIRLCVRAVTRTTLPGGLCEVGEGSRFFFGSPQTAACACSDDTVLSMICRRGRGWR